MTNIKIDIAPSLKWEMREHFSKPLPQVTGYDPQHERCAVLLGAMIPDHQWIVARFVEITNTHDKPRSDFSMNAGDVREAGRFQGFSDADIIGAIHTHPPGSSKDPSINDVFTQPPGMLGIVLHVTSGRLTYYTHNEGFIGKEDI